MENFENMWKLIDKVVKINNRIYQREQANKGHIRQTLMQQAPQPAARQWYKGPKPIDFSGMQES